MENKLIKLEEVITKYKDYLVDENKLKELLVKPKPKTVYDLQKGDFYFYIDTYGDIKKTNWLNDKYDLVRLAIGNVFLTKEDAEFEVERRKVEAELLRLGGTRDMMSLGHNGVKKYFFEYYHNRYEFKIGNYENLNYCGSIYFKSEKECRDAIDTVGRDRIKKYLFYVKD